MYLFCLDGDRRMGLQFLIHLPQECMKYIHENVMRDMGKV